MSVPGTDPGAPREDARTVREEPLTVREEPQTAREEPRTLREEPLTLRELTHRLVAQWLLVVGVALAVFIAVAAWTFLVTPRYESTAVLWIQQQQESGLGAMAGLAQAASSVPGSSLLGLGREDLDTQVGVLQSFRIAAAVVDSTALMVEVGTPAGIRGKVVEVEALGDPDREGKLTLKRSQAGGYDVTVEEPHESRRSLGSVASGGVLDFAGYRLRLADFPPDSVPSKIRIHVLPRYEAVKQLRKHMDIRRQESTSRLVELAYQLPDREMAATVLNGVVAEYVAYKTHADRSDSRYTVTELRRQVAAEADSLAIAEERLRSYQERADVVAPEEEAKEQVGRQAELLLAQDKLQVERTGLAQLLAVIDEHAAARETDPTVAYRQLATFPSLITNRAIQDLLAALLDLENERSALLSRRTEQSRDVVQITERITGMEEELRRLGTNYLESLDEQLSSTSGGLERVNDVLRTYPERQMAYLRLYRDRTMLNEGYLILQRQLRLAEVQEAIRSEGVRVVDPARVAHKDDPEFPKPWVNLFLGLVLGLAAGVGAALVRDFWR